MKKQCLAAAVAATVMVGPSFAQSVSSMTTQAREIILSRLIDPGSLSIRNTSVKSATAPDGSSVSILCGEYNAKNRLGGFTGFKTFIYEPSNMAGVLSFEPNLRLDFLSSDGTGDVSGNPDSAIMAGAKPSDLTASYAKANRYAMSYLPVCLMD